VENAGVEKAAPDDMGGKRGTGKRGTIYSGLMIVIDALIKSKTVQCILTHNALKFFYEVVQYWEQ